MEALVLDLAEKVASAPREKLRRWLQDGTAWEKFVAMVEAQGGDSTALERITEIHRAPVIHEFRSPQDGRLAQLDAGLIGRACVALGAGRTRAGDAIDFAVGCDAFRKVGASLQRGETVLRVHARSEASLREVLPLISEAVTIA